MVESTLNDNNEKGSAIIVGGSLSGLMTAIALAREGIGVRVLEKVPQAPRTGAGLQVEGASFFESGTAKHLRNLTSGGKSSVQLWSSIESRLREAIEKQPLINLHYNTLVDKIGQNTEEVWAITDEGKRITADILIGADGHRSIVRSYVNPNHPNAEFAGYVVWIASVNETALPINKRPDPSSPDVQMLNSPSGFMFGSILESDNSSERRIGCTWYDNTQTPLLRKLGSVEGTVVQHSIDGKDIPQKDLTVLASQAKEKWPEPWLSATLHAIETRQLMGIPIKEYVPKTLVKKCFALVGDAAHVPAPITASGFNESLEDAVVLAKCVATGLKKQLALNALKEYETIRLPIVRRMVQSGHSFSTSFGRK